MVVLAFLIKAVGGSLLALGIINLTLLLLIDLDPERRLGVAAKAFAMAARFDAACVGVGFALCWLGAQL